MYVQKIFYMQYVHKFCTVKTQFSAEHRNYYLQILHVCQICLCEFYLNANLD